MPFGVLFACNVIVSGMSLPKSLERSPAVGDFYGTGIEIWAGFWPVGITEKKIVPIMSNF